VCTVCCTVHMVSIYRKHVCVSSEEHIPNDDAFIPNALFVDEIIMLFT